MAKKIVIVFSVIAGILLLTEGALKFYDKVYVPKLKPPPIEEVYRKYITPDEQRDYYECSHEQLAPYVMFSVRPDFRSATVNTNSLGFRNREIDVKKPEGVYRVVILGGSAAFGIGLPSDDRSFSAILEKKLNSQKGDGKTYEVINASQPGYVSMQELILFEWKLLELKPDLVVTFDGFNDVLISIKDEKRPGYPYFYKKLEELVYGKEKRPFLARKTRIGRRLYALINKKKKEEALVPNDRAVSIYGANLDILCRLARSYNMGVILGFQPIVNFKSPPTDEERCILNTEPEYQRVAYPVYLQAAEEVAKVASANGAGFIDFSSAFDGLDETVFIDNAHLLPKGHEIIADILYRKIKETEQAASGLRPSEPYRP